MLLPVSLQKRRGCGFSRGRSSISRGVSNPPCRQHFSRLVLISPLSTSTRWPRSAPRPPPAAAAARKRCRPWSARGRRPPRPRRKPTGGSRPPSFPSFKKRSPRPRVHLPDRTPPPPRRRLRLPANPVPHPFQAVVAAVAVAIAVGAVVPLLRTRARRMGVLAGANPLLLLPRCLRPHRCMVRK